MDGGFFTNVASATREQMLIPFCVSNEESGSTVDVLWRVEGVHQKLSNILLA